MVQENDALPEWLAESVAVTVTDDVAAVVGVPLMRPDELLIDRPAGRPVADQVYGVVPPDAVTVRLTAVPTVPLWLPGLFTVTVVDGAAENAAVPLGVPRPVGPSQPVPAVHSGAPQVPLLPLVTSNRLAWWAYGYEAGESEAPGVPARA